MIQKLFTKFASLNDRFKETLFRRDFVSTDLFIIFNNKNFNINYKDENKNSYLHLCVLNKRADSAEWLLKNTDISLELKNNKGESASDLLMENLYTPLVDIFLRYNVFNINYIDNEGRTLLHNAVLSGNKKLVQVLIKNGININILDYNNRNVLFDAVSYGNEEILDILLETKGLEINQKDYKGETVLSNPVVLKNDSIAKKLLKKGADPTICGEDGKNFLFHCASTKDDANDFLDIAVENGINIDVRLTNNNTLLMETLSVFYRIPDWEQKRRESLHKLVNNMLLHGVDINGINNDGENGLFEAIRNNKTDICGFFLSKGVNPNHVNNNGETPLMIACLLGMKALDIIVLLLEYGANPNILNKQNRSIITILNDLILYMRGFTSIEGIREYSNELTSDKEYFRVLKELLLNTKLYDLRILDYEGKPYFYTPLLSGDFDLFSLYMTYKFDINQRDKNNLNVFFVYLKNIFENNVIEHQMKSFIIKMMYYKVDIHIEDNEGRSIFLHILNKETNLKLYKNLLDICSYSILKSDNQGRTVMHQAIFMRNLALVNMLYDKDNDVMNISDNFGILPIVYALLFKFYDMVIIFLAKDNIFVTSGKRIPDTIKEKFKPMITTIDDIKREIDDKDLLRKIYIFIDQVKNDFKV